MLLAACVAASGIWTHPVLALDGNAYLGMCRQQDSDLQNGCTGFTAGMLSALMFWNEITVANGGPSQKFCVPPGVGIEQAQDIFIKYQLDHPEQRHLLAGMTAEFALLESFPCR